MMAGLVQKKVKECMKVYDEKVIISIKEKFINSLTMKTLKGRKNKTCCHLTLKDIALSTYLYLYQTKSIFVHITTLNIIHQIRVSSQIRLTDFFFTKFNTFRFFMSWD